MTNLFSAFDPSTSGGMALNWGASCLYLGVLGTSSLFLAPSKIRTTGFLFLSLLHLEFKSIFSLKMKPGSTWFMLSFFVLILINNGLGLFPHIFTSSSHLVFALSLALPLWLGHICVSFVSQPGYAFAHLVPKGTPGALMPFMVLIEIVSNLIRPLTLSVRLMANLTAGHLLLSLLSASASLGAPSLTLSVLGGLVVLMTLEVAVSLIQAYVFTLLSTLYLEEVQTKQLLGSG